MGNKRKRAAKDSAAGPSQPTTKRTKKNPDSKKAPTAATLDKSPFLDHPTIDDRKREAALYELLGSESSSDRINAADAIVSALLAGEGVSEHVLDRHLDKRLFRGLASGRNASRIGFSLVITEVLRQLFGPDDLGATRYRGLTFDTVLGILVERTNTGGNIPGQEERDHYFGQLFGIECFVSAGILFDDKDRWLTIVDLLLKLANKKVWLRSQCGWIIVQALQHMKRKLAEKTLKKLSEEGLAKTTEGVGIWIAALDRFPDMKVPSKPWKTPLSTKALGDLPAIMKDSGREASNPQDVTGRKQKHSNWTAQLHWVWDVILSHFTKTSTADSTTANNFVLFWNKVVDEGFFSKTASDSQKFSGFMIFQKMIEGASGSPFVVEAIFSKNLMVCLMNQASREDRYLHRAALKALKSIETTVQNEPSILEPVLTQLLGENGVYSFDQRTNTKTVEKLLQSTTPANGNAVLDVIKSKNDLEPPLSLQTYSSYLFKLASLPIGAEKTESGDEVPVPVLALQELARITYSKSGDASSAPDEKIQETLRNRVTSAFAKFARRPEDFAHLCSAVLLIEADLGTDEEIESELARALERLKELLDHEDAGSDLKAPYHGLALLHAVGVLQLYNEEPDALETLMDLEQCYEKLKARELDGEGGISEFLVEILLSMVAQPSSLMRQVSQQVFEAFTPVLSSQAIQLLTDPLSANENEKGQQALFSTQDEDMNGAADGESDDDPDQESLDSDVEIVDVEDAPSDAGDSEASDSDSDSDSDEEEPESSSQEGDDGKDDLDALDNALAQVLKSHRLDKDAEAESSDDSDMSDSEMMELDEKLVEIFKQRTKTTSTKKGKRDAKESVVNFKHRVLDLLAIFVKNEAAASNPLAFEVLLPLLQLVRTTTTKALANKACEIVITFGKALKKSRGNQEPAAAGTTSSNNNTDEEALMELLSGIHTDASKDMSHVYARAASTASLAVASVLCASAERTEEVFQLYAQSQLKWYRGEVKMQPSFFTDWLNWCQGHASNTAAAQAKE